MQQNLNLSTSQNQELKQAQTLNVSQLQSLNLLQTTNLELQQKVAEELQVNPVLELVSNGPEIDFGDFSASNSSQEDNQNKAAELAESAGDDEVAKAAAGEAERLEKDGK